MAATAGNLLVSKDFKSSSYLDRLLPKHRNVNRALSFTPLSSSILAPMKRLNKTFDASSDSGEQNRSPRNELYRLQKQSYENAKKHIASELEYILKDPSIVVVSDWLKVRGTLRDWTKLWAVLKPGYMLLYRSPISMDGVWVGTIVLSSCEVIQRPSKKTGFCFKIWHPLEKSIWTQKGPRNEQFGALTFPLPINYLICRASDEATGYCWMDGLELTMKCSKLLKKPFLTYDVPPTSTTSNSSILSNEDSILSNSNSSTNDINLSRTNLLADDDRMSETSADMSRTSRSGTTQSEMSQDRPNPPEEEKAITPYILAPPEEMGELGNAAQTEEVADENKSLIVHLLKQVRPGMDLAKVVLPTFILESRSFLEKLSDYYHHCDILEETVNSPDPLERMKTVVKFYLSGFYKKPKGLKKPYNPVLGEVYRCYFHHTKNDSKTFYIAEQISHHPPITSFYVSNRKEGFCIQGNILTRSKFYGKYLIGDFSFPFQLLPIGNSLQAILDGSARLTLLNRGEDYNITMPYANCKGILIGRLTMELGGKVTITCEKTRYSADIEFKLKPFIGGQELTNLVEGKIRLEDDVLYTFSGHWDDEIILIDKTTHMKSVLWKVTPSVINSRLKRYVVPIEQQQENESERLWQRVTSAIRQNDQVLATEEKTIIESEQRKLVKERKITGIEWHPCLFSMDENIRQWTYNHIDTHPWDSHNDISTYETNFMICTHTCHHRDPMIVHERTVSFRNTHSESILTDRKASFSEDITSILKSIETNLMHTSERIDFHERQICQLQTQQSIRYPSFYLIHFLLLIFVAFILKYLFRSS
ncbi:unnamed protein product [Adineta ricciae]|uniref:PH domain-containing protein n=1 Tax=Adineta ricciae TaxID=249248 RepID=A0A813X048_ADIRI|nr:unnamed protein product [Adineta ricciae]CAF1581059.1 unnamed protein product [Adineta ricciae]